MLRCDTSIAVWVGDELVEAGVDILVFMQELASQYMMYMERTGKDFLEEILRKRIKLRLEAGWNYT